MMKKHTTTTMIFNKTLMSYVINKGSHRVKEEEVDIEKIIEATRKSEILMLLPVQGRKNAITSKSVLYD